MLEVVRTCPLGSTCEEIKDGKIHRCVWNQKMVGKDPSTGEAVDRDGCSMTWLPVLLVENSAQQRSTAAAIESFRNEMVNNNAQQLLLNLPITNQLPRA